MTDHNRLFVDTYFQLSDQEEQTFQAELGRLDVTEQEQIMQIVTSWMQKGIDQGEKSLILRQLEYKFNALPADIRSQVESLALAQLDQLGEALLGFNSIEDLNRWLANS
jgi:predicted transposase YdaD